MDSLLKRASIASFDSVLCSTSILVQLHFAFDSFRREAFALPMRTEYGMTNWYAVFVGFVVSVIAGVVAFAVPGIGHIGAGLIGGFAAGYVAGGGLGSGFWHGLLAGALGGIVVALFLGLAGTVVGGLAGGPVGSLFGGIGIFAAALLVAFIMALDSALGGMVGSLLKS